MDASIPPSIQPLIDAYLRALEPLRGHFYGIYIYGSIALGAFEEAVSDIDVIALTQGAWSPQELKQLIRRLVLRPLSHSGAAPQDGSKKHNGCSWPGEWTRGITGV